MGAQFKLEIMADANLVRGPRRRRAFIVLPPAFARRTRNWDWVLGRATRADVILRCELLRASKDGGARGPSFETPRKRGSSG
jgi:hypothetical protein